MTPRETAEKFYEEWWGDTMDSTRLGKNDDKRLIDKFEQVIQDASTPIAELTRINEELHAEVRTLKFKVQTLTNDLDNAIRASAPRLMQSGNPLTGDIYGTHLQTLAKQESNITLNATKDAETSPDPEHLS